MLTLLTAIKTNRTLKHYTARGARVARGDVPYERITDELVDAGISVTPFTVDLKGFEAYVQRAGYARLPEYYRGGADANAREKYLEHYVSLVLLDPKPGAVLVDVASMNSPFADVTADLYRLDTHRQDLMFPPGVHGRTIGGYAASMPVPDGFADHLSLHCSLEHFEGDADERFVREVARVLRPRGTCCSLPLYTSTAYAIQTHVRRWRVHDIAFDSGDLVYVADHWGPPFGRFYDAPSLVRRIVRNLGGMKLRIFEVTNAHEVDPTCYLKYALLIEKPA